VIAYFLLGLGLLVGFLLILKWASEAEPRQLLKALGWTVGVLGLVFGLLLLWVGRYQLAWIALPALIGLASRWRQIRSAIRSARGPSQGQTSEVETRFVRMSLEHDTGVMSGEVLDGTHAGRRIEELDLEQLVQLWREAQAADAQSAAVIEAYLDKLHGDAWREAADAGAGADDARAGETGASGRGGGPMTREEALEILGLEEGATREDIQRAYRTLMKKLHPDTGGSDWFAAKLNEAKRVLIGD
jgi:hypothetical protein